MISGEAGQKNDKLTEHLPREIRRRKCLLVLGMHRSGTSALSGALAALGLQRPSRELPAQPDNEKGFFEPSEIVAIHEHFLSSLGMDWADWRSLPGGWEQSTHYADALSALETAVRDDFPGNSDFIVKDPRICRFVSLWIELARRLDLDLIALHIFRRPVEVAASLKARNEMDDTSTNALWLRHVTDVELATREMLRRFVSFDDLIDDEQKALETLLQGINLQNATEELHVRSKAVDFLDPSLKKQNIARVANGSFSRWNQTLYEGLERLVETPYDNDVYLTFEKIASEFDHASEAFDPLIKALSLRLEAQRVEVDTLRPLEADRACLVASLRAATQEAERVPRIERELFAARSQAALLTEETRLRIALGVELAAEQTRHGVSERIAARVPDLEQRLSMAESRIGHMEEAAIVASSVHAKLAEEHNRTEKRLAEMEMEAQRIPLLESDLACAQARAAALADMLSNRLALLRRIFSKSHLGPA